MKRFRAMQVGFMRALHRAALSAVCPRGIRRVKTRTKKSRPRAAFLTGG
jgi:hypothetical protein